MPELMTGGGRETVVSLSTAAMVTPWRHRFSTTRYIGRTIRCTAWAIEDVVRWLAESGKQNHFALQKWIPLRQISEHTPSATSAVKCRSSGAVWLAESSAEEFWWNRSKLNKFKINSPRTIVLILSDNYRAIQTEGPYRSDTCGFQINKLKSTEPFRPYYLAGLKDYRMPIWRMFYQ